jgi:hypothetical protein
MRGGGLVFSSIDVGQLKKNDEQYESEMSVKMWVNAHAIK